MPYRYSQPEIKLKFLLFALLFFQASFFANAKSELLIWYHYRYTEKTAIDLVIEQFMQKHPDIGVRSLSVPFDAYPDKITAAIPRGRGPDIFIFPQDRLGGWVESGNTLEPITFYLNGEQQRFIPSTMDAMTYRGTTYGLPFNFKCVTLIYNKKLIKSPPANETEMLVLAKDNTDIKNGRYGLAYAYNNFYYHAVWMNAFGGQVLTPEAKAVINSPENKKSFNFLLEMLSGHQILPVEPSSALVLNLFNKGLAAMIIDGAWVIDDILPEIDFGLALLPEVERAGGRKMQPWMTVEGIYMSKHSANKDKAWQLIKFLTNKNAAKIMALQGFQTPANKYVYDDPVVAADPRLAAYRLQAEHAIPMPNVAEMSVMWPSVTTAVNKILNGTTVDAALQEAQEKVEKDINALRGIN